MIESIEPRRDPRTTLGLIYTDDDDIDSDLQAFLPDTILTWTERTRTLPAEDPLAWLRKMAADPGIEEAAGRLAPTRPSAIAYVVNSISVIRGPGGAADISHRIRNAGGGVPSITTSEAMVEALRALDATRIAVAVPYGPSVNDQLTSFLSAAGRRVVSLSGLDLPNANNWEALTLSDSDVVRLAVEADTPGAEAIYLGCTSLRSAHLVRAMEEAVGKPVVTANGCTMWAALRLMGVEYRPTHLGRLFLT